MGLSLSSLRYFLGNRALLNFELPLIFVMLRIPLYIGPLTTSIPTPVPARIFAIVLLTDTLLVSLSTLWLLASIAGCVRSAVAPMIPLFSAGRDTTLSICSHFSSFLADSLTVCSGTASIAFCMTLSFRDFRGFPCIVMLLFIGCIFITLLPVSIKQLKLEN